MQITSGKFKHKKILTKIKSSKQPSFRPTSARTRLAIFNIIDNSPYISEGYILNSRVLDMFCGSGSFGFEALSRGAAYATFVDESSEQLQLINENAKLLNVEGAVSVVKAKSQSLPIANKKYNLVYIDPPYGQKLINVALKSLVANGWLDDKCLIIAEHDKYEKIEPIPTLEVFDHRTYGRTNLTFISRNSGQLDT